MQSLPQLPLPPDENEPVNFEAIFTYTLSRERLNAIMKENGIIISESKLIDYLIDLDTYLSETVELNTEKLVRKHLKDNFKTANEIDTLDEPEQSEDDEDET